MKFFLLAFMCLLIIGGAFYGGIYTEKKHGNTVQAIALKEKGATNAVAKAKELEEKIEIAKAKGEVAKAILAEEKLQVKSEEYKKDLTGRSKRVVVIDPGHSSIVDLATEPEAPGSKIMKIKEPGGGHGDFTKTPEYVVNMVVAVKLRSLLQEKGYTVIMTKTKSTQVLGSIARAEVGNKAKADLVIRIHADSSDETSVQGSTMLIPTDTKYTDSIYKTSKEYGQIVFNNLIKVVGMNSRGVVEKSDMTGFNWSKVPVMLIEMGFQSNFTEDHLLTTDSYQDKLAKGLADGIDQALK